MTAGGRDVSKLFHGPWPTRVMLRGTMGAAASTTDSWGKAACQQSGELVLHGYHAAVKGDGCLTRKHQHWTLATPQYDADGLFEAKQGCDMRRCTLSPHAVITDATAGF